MKDTPRLLVVDDEPKICEFLQDLLTREGYTVDTCRSAEQALDSLQAHSCDLLITDLRMPGMDGFELIHRVKRICEALPIVVITGYASIKTAVRALRAGVQDYILKPFNIDEMRATVARTLDMARLQEENRALTAQLKEAMAERPDTAEAVPAAAADDAQREAEFRNLALMHEVHATLAPVLNPDDLLPLCVTLTNDKLDTECCSMMLRENDWLVVRACEEERRDAILGERQHVGEGVSGWVAQSAQALLVKDLTGNARFGESVGRRYKVDSFVCAPLSYEGRSLGVVSVNDKRSGEPFDESDLARLTLLANFMSPSIHNARRHRALELDCSETLRTVVTVFEAKTPYLSGHSQRTADHALAAARAMGLTPHEQGLLRLAAILHDIGMIGIPDSILSKPDSLAPDEMEIVRQHPIMGERIADGLAILEETKPIIRGHHERPDGQGYPDGLEGTDIPLMARILAIAETYDAMTSDRPYRTARTAQEAAEEIQACAGRQFDPELARIFCETVLEGT